MPFDQQDFELRRFAPGVPQQDLPAPVDPVLDTLVKARALLSNKAHWAQGNYCVGDGYCALGALLHVRGLPTSGIMVNCAEISDEWRFLERFTPQGRSLHNYNDSVFTTHADVLALFDRAIAARKAGG